MLQKWILRHCSLRFQGVCQISVSIGRQSDICNAFFCSFCMIKQTWHAGATQWTAPVQQYSPNKYITGSDWLLTHTFAPTANGSLWGRKPKRRTSLSGGRRCMKTFVVRQGAAQSRRKFPRVWSKKDDNSGSAASVWILYLKRQKMSLWKLVENSHVRSITP